MLELRAGPASLVVVPELGGGILGWTHGATKLLRHAVSRAVIPGTVREMAAFPLIPYSNRIAYGRFQFDNETYQLTLNFGDSPHSIHGVGWQRAWKVAQASPDAATLTLHHTPDTGWPFPFLAEQRFELTPTTLRLTLSVTNLHNAPAPAGLGLHPFFPRGDATLQFAADAVWRNGANHLPSEKTPVPDNWNHKSPRQVGSASLDNCFEGWPGIATLRWPDRTITLEASDIFRHVVVYTPPGMDFFCVEAVSHMNDAINRGGMRVLSQGETLSGTITLRVAAI